MTRQGCQYMSVTGIFGIGSDGLITIGPSDKADFRNEDI